MDSDRENDNERARLGERISESRGEVGAKMSTMWSKAARSVVVEKI
jgi:hypothetical protein